MPDHPSFEDQPLRSWTEHDPVPAGSHLLPRITGYEIVRLLAEGGMGVVYEAWQEKPRRRVALKLLRPGLVTPALLRRFSREIDILGRLEHPAIARIYEAGSDDSGGISQPFFAMEYVEGVEISRYVREQNLGVRERLALFGRVVSGVHYAHQKGIIHRDLKPGNVFVDAAGTPKILDFGVARAVEADDSIGTLTQDKSALFGTLQYMSPEQAAGQGADVDIRSDVYSLGVMLFELLAGERPFRLNTTSIPEAIRIVHEAEPPKLGNFGHALRGDLEIIVATAMAKDKDRRYTSAAALADDLQRFLDSEPIFAHPPSNWYRIAKFARRNKALVGATLGIFAALTLGLASASVGLIRARRAEAEAVIQNDLAQSNLNQAIIAVDQFAASVATGPLANIQDAKPILSQLLSNAIDFCRRLPINKLTDEQLVKMAHMLRSCGWTYMRIIDFRGAEQAYRNAAQAMQTLYARHPRDRGHLIILSDITLDIARSRIGDQKYDEAIAAAMDAVGINDEFLKRFPNNPAVLYSLSDCWILIGQLNARTQRIPDAIEAYNKAIQLRSALVRQQPDQIEYNMFLARAFSQCGSCYKQAGQMSLASSHFARAHELLWEFLQESPDDKSAQKDMRQLLKTYVETVERPTVITILQESLPFWEQLSRDHPTELPIWGTLQWIYGQLGTSRVCSVASAATNPPLAATPPPANEAGESVPSIKDTTEYFGTNVVIDALDAKTLREHSGQIGAVRGRVNRITIKAEVFGRSRIPLGVVNDGFSGYIDASVLPDFVRAFGEGLSDLASKDVIFYGLIDNSGGPVHISLTDTNQVRILPSRQPDDISVNNLLLPSVPALNLNELRTHDGPLIAEGKICRVVRIPKYTILRFESSGRRRFSAIIPDAYLPALEESFGGDFPINYSNHMARVAGYVYIYSDDPCIAVRSPRQISIEQP